MVRRALGILVVAIAALGCGAAPREAATPTGTLVVYVRSGAERVPFDPAAARMGQASSQLAAVVGRAVEVEVDGALLPQTREAAEEVLADLLEAVARDLDALRKEEPGAFELARRALARVTVRYSPAATAERGRWGRASAARFDAQGGVVEITRAEARWRALDRGDVASALLAAHRASQAARYARVMPDALPRAEWRAWYDYHRSGAQARDDDPYEGFANALSPFRVRGMLRLHALAVRAGEDALAREARRWLVEASGSFGSAYHHAREKVLSAPPTSSFRAAESEYVRWLNAELPRMSLDERDEIARHLYVQAPRDDSGGSARYAAWAFPGVDKMAFGLAAVDLWIRDGEPPRGDADPRDLHPLYGRLVCPLVVSRERGRVVVRDAGRCDHELYRLAVSEPPLEAALAKAMLDRRNTGFVRVAFTGVRHAAREPLDRVRFLRRFEEAPEVWRVGADVLFEHDYRPSAPQLEEGRRLWRTTPTARGTVLFWFGRHLEHRYDDHEWPELLQGTLADATVLASYLQGDGERFALVPALWPALAPAGRMAAITARARTLLDAKEEAEARRSVASTLVRLALILCADRAVGELAELHAFAQTELPRRPGAGLSDAVAASDPAACKPPREDRPRRRGRRKEGQAW